MKDGGHDGWLCWEWSGGVADCWGTKNKKGEGENLACGWGRYIVGRTVQNQGYKRQKIDCLWTWPYWLCFSDKTVRIETYKFRQSLATGYFRHGVLLHTSIVV
jgi:hypothetical protein